MDTNEIGEALKRFHRLTPLYRIETHPQTFDARRQQE
jgi:hypothetical protein